MALLRKLAGDLGSTEDYEIKSIIDNLNNIFNSTRDYGFFLHDFGISDYRYLSTREDIAKAIIVEVSENIALFEPRVLVNEISSVQDNKLIRLSFLIDAVIRNNGQPLKLFLDPVNDRLQVSL
jgi:predicted component of type VI protein secretion system